jgi:hypothetical protein
MSAVSDHQGSKLSQVDPLSRGSRNRSRRPSQAWALGAKDLGRGGHAETWFSQFRKQMRGPAVQVLPCAVQVPSPSSFEAEEDHGLRGHGVISLAVENKFPLLSPSRLWHASICTLRRSVEGGALSPALRPTSLGQRAALGVDFEVRAFSGQWKPGFRPGALTSLRKRTGRTGPRFSRSDPTRRENIGARFVAPWAHLQTSKTRRQTPTILRQINLPITNRNTAHV